MRIRWFVGTAAFLLFMGLPALPAAGQSPIAGTAAGNRPAVSFRFMRPNLAGENDLTATSGTYDLSLFLPAGGRRALVVTVPWNSFSSEGAEGEDALGNVYLGFQTRDDDPVAAGVLHSWGIFLPTAAEDQNYAGPLALVTNFHDFHRSLPRTLTLHGNVAYHGPRRSGGPEFGVEIGPRLLIPTDDEDRDIDLYAHYGLAAGVRLGRLLVDAELLGLLLVSADRPDLSERFNHSLEVAGQLTGYAVRPALFYRIPLDDDFDRTLDGTIGLRIDVRPGSRP